MKRSYELMLVLRPEMDVTEQSATQLVEKLVGSEATVAGISLLGKKMLAYPINKQMEGIYVLAKLEGAHTRVGEIEKKVQLGTDVLRYLLTVVN
jgi:small subunit ribosomal protein S6